MSFFGFSGGHLLTVLGRALSEKEGTSVTQPPPAVDAGISTGSPVLPSFTGVETKVQRSADVWGSAYRKLTTMGQAGEKDFCSHTGSFVAKPLHFQLTTFHFNSGSGAWLGCWVPPQIQIQWAGVGPRFLYAF